MLNAGIAEVKKKRLDVRYFDYEYDNYIGIILKHRLNNTN